MPVITARDQAGRIEQSSNAYPSKLKAAPAPTPEAPAAPAPESRQLDTQAEAQTTAATTQDEALSPKFAALAKQERKLRELRKALDAEKAEIEARKSSHQTVEEYKKALKAKLAENPLAALSDEFEVSYDHLANSALNQQLTPEQQELKELRRELAAIKAQNEETANKFTSQQQAQYEQAVKQISHEVNSLVDSNEEFQAIKAMGAQKAVVELIEQTFKTQGRLLSNEEACKMVDDYIVEQSYQAAATLKKVQARLKPPEPLATESQTQQPQPGLKTITNQVANTATRPLSRAELRAKLIARMQGQEG